MDCFIYCLSSFAFPIVLSIFKIFDNQKPYDDLFYQFLLKSFEYVQFDRTYRWLAFQLAYLKSMLTKSRNFFYKKFTPVSPIYPQNIFFIITKLKSEFILWWKIIDKIQSLYDLGVIVAFNFNLLSINLENWTGLEPMNKIR